MGRSAPARHILLIGLRASGKSTLAERLARRLGCAHADLDEDVRRALGGRTIADIWEELGEARFRAEETTALRARLDAAPPSVVALGGGTPTAPGAAELIRRAQEVGRAAVVYLRCAPDVLAGRLRAQDADDSRPSLTGAPAAEEVNAVFARRDPLFGALADVVVDASGGIEGTERAVLVWLEDGGATP